MQHIKNYLVYVNKILSVLIRRLIIDSDESTICPTDCPTEFMHVECSVVIGIGLPVRIWNWYENLWEQKRIYFD